MFQPPAPMLLFNQGQQQPRFQSTAQAPIVQPNLLQAPQQEEKNPLQGPQSMGALQQFGTGGASQIGMQGLQGMMQGPHTQAYADGSMINWGAQQAFPQSYKDGSTISWNKPHVPGMSNMGGGNPAFPAWLTSMFQ